MAVSAPVADWLASKQWQTHFADHSLHWTEFETSQVARGSVVEVRVEHWKAGQKRLDLLVESLDMVEVGSVDSDSTAVAAVFAVVEVAANMLSMADFEAVAAVHNTQHLVVHHKLIVVQVVQKRRSLFLFDPSQVAAE